MIKRLKSRNLSKRQLSTLDQEFIYIYNTNSCLDWLFEYGLSTARFQIHMSQAGSLSRHSSTTWYIKAHMKAIINRKGKNGATLNFIISSVELMIS